MFKKTLLFSSVSVALLAPLSAQEATTETAPSNPALEAVLAHVPTLLDKAWQSTFHVKGFEGEEENMSITAAVKFQDKKHFSLGITMITEDEFEGEKTMNFDVLADGAFIYLDSPSMGELSGGMANGPVKVELDLLEKMVGSQMGGGMSPSGDMDAMKNALKEALSGFDFKEEGSSDLVRRFIITNEEVNGFISFDKKHWFLSAMEMTFDEGRAVVNTTGNAVVENFPEGTFAFTVAEGQTVMDLTGMIAMSMPQVEEEEDDLEF